MGPRLLVCISSAGASVALWRGRLVQTRRYEPGEEGEAAFAQLLATVRDLPVVFTVYAHPGRRFEGRVVLVSPQVNLSTRMFDFGALVPNADRQLKAGTFARGELVLERAVPTRVVPLGAVLSSSGVSRVFVVDGAAAQARVVKTGRVLGDAQEILSGVSDGQTVVVTGHGKLADGMLVEVRP